MRYRTGRKNGHTIYLQTGEEPDDNDPFVGSCVTPGHARNLVAHATAGLEVEAASARPVSPTEETNP